MSFDDEMNEISREMLDLKSQHQTSAEALKTISYSVPLSFDLELYNFGDGNVGRSIYMAKVMFDTGGNNPLIGIDYGINNLNNVNIRDCDYFDENSGMIGKLIYIVDYNSSDVSKLVNGQSVSLSYNVNITSSCDMNINVKYEDLWVN